jgi:hypothetical protein
MIEEVLEGGCRALVGLLTVGVGLGFYKLGRIFVEGGLEETSIGKRFTPGMPKWKAALMALGIASFLGLVASRDYVEYDGSGDKLFDPGQVVEVIKNSRPWESFTLVCVFTLTTIGLGIANAQAREASSDN